MALNISEILLDLGNTIQNGLLLGKGPQHFPLKPPQPRMICGSTLKIVVNVVSLQKLCGCRTQEKNTSASHCISECLQTVHPLPFIIIHIF